MRDDYRIGYGKPPTSTQFRPGQSGNPKGRPKEAKSLGRLIHAVCNETVRVKEGNRYRRISKIEVGLKHLLNKAASGDIRAIKEVTKLYEVSDAAAFLPPLSAPPFQVNFIRPHNGKRASDDPHDTQSEEDEE